MAEAMNHRTVFLYSPGSSSSSRRERNSATTCSRMATTTAAVDTMDRTLHWPDASKPQKRKKASEKPSRTVIAVMMPVRKPVGTDCSGCPEADAAGCSVLLGHCVRPADLKRAKNMDRINRISGLTGFRTNRGRLGKSITPSAHGGLGPNPVNPVHWSNEERRQAARSARLRQPRQRVPSDAEHGPVFQGHGAQRLVELPRRRVPVQHRPLEAPAAPVLRDARRLQQQRLAVAAAAKLRASRRYPRATALHAQERREVVAEHRKADRGFAFEREHTSAPG